MPRRLTEELIRDTPILRTSDTVETAIERLLGTDLPALPVVDAKERLRGIFGPREFLAALFPAYFRELPNAGFVPRSLDETLERRASCRRDPIERYIDAETVHVPADFSDAQVAESFLHHPTPILPVFDEQRHVIGVITRQDFARRLGRRLLEGQ